MGGDIRENIFIFMFSLISPHTLTSYYVLSKLTPHPTLIYVGGVGWGGDIRENVFMFMFSII
jgi:hypothetical protein